MKVPAPWLRVLAPVPNSGRETPTPKRMEWPFVLFYFSFWIFSHCIMAGRSLLFSFCLYSLIFFPGHPYPDVFSLSFIFSFSNETELIKIIHMQAYFIDRRLTLTNVVWKYTLHLTLLSMHFVLLFFVLLAQREANFPFSAAAAVAVAVAAAVFLSFTWRRRPSVWAGNSFGPRHKLFNAWDAHTRACEDH